MIARDYSVRMLDVSDVRVLPAVFEEPLQSRDQTSAKERDLCRSTRLNMFFFCSSAINQLKGDGQKSELTVIASHLIEKINSAFSFLSNS